MKDSAASLANRRIRHCDESILRDYPAFRRPVERWGSLVFFPTRAFMIYRTEHSSEMLNQLLLPQDQFQKLNNQSF